MNKCVICGKEYTAKRATSKYCGSACKQANYRNVTELPVTVTSVTLRDEAVAVRPVTLKPEPARLSLPITNPAPLVTIKPRKQFAGEFTKTQQVSRKGFNN